MMQHIHTADSSDRRKLDETPPPASGAQFRAVVDNLAQGIVIVDPESEMLYWNPAAKAMHGFANSEDANRRLQDLPGIFEVSTLEGNVLGLSDWPIARLLRGELIGDVKLRVRRLASDWSRVFQYSGARVPYAGDGSLTFLAVNDVTEQRIAEEAQMRLAAIVNSSDDAIVGTTLNGLISNWNRGAEALFGYSAAEMVGRPVTALAPSDAPPEDAVAVREINSGVRVEQFEGTRVCKDGRRIDVSLTLSPIIDGEGRVIGKSRIARDITGRKRHERELERLNRLYAALSHVNQAITRTPERLDLFQRVCRALVDEGGFAMVWVGWHTPGDPRIVPQAAWGGNINYLAKIPVYMDDRAEGRGPSGTAFREGRPYFCNNVFDDPQTLPWRDSYRRSRFHASAALPIRLNGSVRGILCVYSYEPDVFQDKEMSLLTEAAADVSFALDNADQAEARRLAEEVARRERIFSSALIESMPGIFYFIDGRGKILRWNQNVTNVSGYSADEIARMRGPDFIIATQKDQVEQMARDVFAQGETSFEGDFRSKDGSTARYFFTGKRVVVDGIVGLVGMGVDISARTHAEAEVRRLNAELERRVIERTAQLEAANKDLEAFSYSVSHDLRAPLRTVNGYAEIVLAEYGADLPDEGRRLLKRIRSRGLYMGVLIADLLEFSRLGRKPLNLREVDMQGLAETVLRGVAPQTEGRHIEFNLGDVPPCYGDSSLLRQVWVNLISNAIKYTRGRDPAIIDIGSRIENGASAYFVRDNGVGFDMQFAHKLFGVFQRLHLADEFEGAGVGLAIVQRIVERHGGKVWAVGQEQHGATFYFSMPSPETAS
jgi:PAS domain S-box-containing protein